MTIENNSSDAEVGSDRLADVLQFPSQLLKGYAVLPPPELRTEHQGAWVSVDFHREGADWVYAAGAAHESFVTTVELNIAEVS